MILLLLALLGCNPVDTAEVEYPDLVPGPPMAGAAEGTLDLPIGTPMGGYSARCTCLSGMSRPDSRDSAYSTSFVESAGVQMRPGIKVIWLANGDDHLVIAKADVIYSYDALVSEITRQLEAATGEDLQGKVVLATNHSHFSYGPFSDQIHFYLGGDYYNEEIFERFAQQVVEVALEAYEGLQPAAIGTGWARDWDPNNEIYRDRRGENNDLAVWDDAEPGYGKDPYLNVLRVDTADGDPLALMFTFGIHGVANSDNSALISPDAAGGLEVGLQEAFDHPVVVMHAQGAGGDASPAGRDHGGAKVESLGELARDRIMALWADIPTTTDPIRLETASRHIWEYYSQIRVTRNGTVDWYYKPLDEYFQPDNIIYDENGDIISPIDEFRAPYGAAFCGNGSFDIPVGDIGATVFPYDACMDVELMTRLLYAFFELPEGSIPLPLPSSFKAGTTATRFGPLPTVTPEGEVVDRDLLVGFFPGEPLAMYTEQWRRRVQAELGYDMPLLVGYAQDHEGYLLIPEDWLVGGYEPNIAIWGPLQGEHIMEGVLTTVREVLDTDVREDPDPNGWYAPVEYPDRPLPEVRPDTTESAGTRLTEPPDAYFWLPEGFELSLDIPEEVPRVQGQVQLAWLGGDPGVDNPVVALERLDGESWVPVTSHSGRPITDTFQDILVAWTPDPLYPASAEQTHYWWAVWQAVGHDFDRAGLPLGTYRLRVTGQRYLGESATWPWDTTPYTFDSDPFEVVPAEIAVTLGDGGLWASIPAPADSYRLVDIDGRSTGDNPVRGTLHVEVQTDSETLSHDIAPTTISDGRSWIPVDLTDAVSVTVTDAWGNTGSTGD